MPRADVLRRLAGIALALVAAAATAADDAPAARHRAEIRIDQRAPFVVLPLDVATYARSEAPRLADLGVADARGQRVPFALLPPAPAAAAETLRELPLYALPPRSPGQAWPAPVELRIRDGAVTLIQRGGGNAAAPVRAGGWLFDLGDPAAGRRDARRIELRFADGAGDFDASYRLETSGDLQRWSDAGAGTLVRLGRAPNALLQARVALPPAPPRFVRLAWDAGIASPPAVAGATLVVAAPPSPAEAPPARLTLQALAGASAADTMDGRALVFDLGGVLPVAAIDLELGAGTRIAPVSVQARDRADGPWHEIGHGVFWQLERDGRLARSEPLAVQGTARQIRVVGDERAARLDAARTKAMVHAPLARLVVAMQGEPPLRLQVGDATAKAAAALPLATLVPDLAVERPRFGASTLLAWSEAPEAAARARDAERRAALRPWLLWALLGAGVAALGAMVWRLARKSPG